MTEPTHTPPPEADPADTGASVALPPESADGAADSPPPSPRFGLLDVVAVAFLLAAALYLFGKGIGDYGLWEPWEPKYPSAVREMIAHNDAITPWYEGEIRYTKPILIYWAMYAAMSQWGDNEFAARLPSVLAGALGVLFVFIVLRRLRGRAAGILGALTLMTLPQYFYMARQAMPDMLLVATLAGAMACFALGRFGPGFRTGKSRLPFIGFYACVGLSFLAKGPVGGAIVVGSLGAFLLLDFQPKLFLQHPRAIWSEIRGFLSRYHVLLGILVFLAVAGPWYVMMIIRHGKEFFGSFIVDENVSRFAGAIRGHEGESIYYIRTMFYGMYPWLALLPISTAFLCGRERSDQQRQSYYFLCWTIAPLLIFTWAGTKIDHYILPIAPGLAALVGLFWADYFDREEHSYVRPALFFAIPFLGAFIQDFFIVSESSAFGPLLILDVILPEYAMNHGTGEIYLTAIKQFAYLWCAACVLAALRRRSVLAVFLMVAITYGHAIHMSHYLYPPQSDQRSFKHYVKKYRDLRGPDARLLQVGSEKHSIRYYLGDEAYHWYASNDLQAFINDAISEGEVFLIVPAGDARGIINMLERRSPDEDWTVLDERQRHYSLLGIKRQE